MIYGGLREGLRERLRCFPPGARSGGARVELDGLGVGALRARALAAGVPTAAVTTRERERSGVQRVHLTPGASFIEAPISGILSAYPLEPPG